MIDTITLILVDDHAMVRRGVRAYLETHADIQIAGEAGSGAEAVKLCAELVPDVVLLDLVMPGMDGVEATRQIKQVSPRTHVVILTSYHEDSHVLPAIKAGALSYLLKDVSSEELLAAIRKAAQGEAVLHPRIAMQLMQSLQAPKPDAPPNPFADLSQRELEVLQLIAQGLSNAAIGAKLFISEKTVKSHVGNILSKLHLDDRTQAAVYAWRQGFMKADEN
jgi:two-component system, NarL family, response regulator LiaR